MKYTRSLLAIATLAVLSAASARAAVIYSVNFTGIVFQTQGATGETLGNTVSGHFDLNGTTGNFQDFVIDGKSVAAGFQSLVSIVPSMTDSFYTAQVSPVSLGSPSNSSFTLDLSALTSWPTSDTALTLLTDKTQLTTNLDTVNNPASAFPSMFSYYTANPDGTNVVSLGANLTSIAATATPEPGSLALVASSLLGLGLLLRRRA